MPKQPEKDRRFSDDPYSSIPVDSRGKARRVGSNSEKAQNVLCAEAQADGVPCFELGRLPVVRDLGGGPAGLTLTAAGPVPSRERTPQALRL